MVENTKAHASYATSERYLRCSPELSMRSVMRSGLLWLIGIPLPIILILWLVTGHA